MNETLDAPYLPVWVDKLEAAVRQLRVAVRLHFEECDSIALHTLVAAAHGIIADIASGTRSQSTIGTSLRLAADFFRQARDSVDRLNIEPLAGITQDLLFDAVRTLQGIAKDIPDEAKLYWAWFMCTRPEQFQNCGPAVEKILTENRHLAKMTFSEIRQFMRFQQILNTAEPLPQWALLGMSPLTGAYLLKVAGGEIDKAGGNVSQKGPTETDEGEVPSAEYLESAQKFEQEIRECCSVSKDCEGISSPTGSHFWASILFTTLCTRAISLLRLVPYTQWSGRAFRHWDFASAANLTRSLLELRIAFFYLCIEECSESEWNCRWNIFNVHDCVSRIHMFSEQDPTYDIAGFQGQLSELQGRLLANAYFVGLPKGSQRQFLGGKQVYLSSLEEIAVRSGVALRDFRWLYKFLSTHVHGHPMSYYRMDDGGRGLGLYSSTEENYTVLCLSLSLTLMGRSREEMRRKFLGLKKGDGRPRKSDNSTTAA